MFEDHCGMDVKSTAFQWAVEHRGIGKTSFAVAAGADCDLRCHRTLEIDGDDRTGFMRLMSRYNLVRLLLPFLSVAVGKFMGD